MFNPKLSLNLSCFNLWQIQGCRFGPELKTNPGFSNRSLHTICGGLFPKMFLGDKSATSKFSEVLSPKPCPHLCVHRTLGWAPRACGFRLARPLVRAIWQKKTCIRKRIWMELWDPYKWPKINPKHSMYGIYTYIYH